ncbi:DNA repair protein RecO [Patescibacteria group bacterium]|nr:DNA repair protein RecO [Patescibacteria group bacterium]
MSQQGYLTGIVLQKKDFKEFDQLISFYSQEYGKVEVFIRSSRKITSKLAPIVAEPFALVSLKVVQGKNHYHLIGGEIKEHFKNILNSYQKLSKINFLFSQINQLLKLRKPDPKIQSLIVKFLRKANNLDELKLPIIFSAFLIKFLSFLGYQPEVVSCLICHQNVLTKANFNFTKGGIVCLKHQSIEEDQVKIEFPVLEILQKLLYKDFDFLINQEFNQRDLIRARQVLNKFLKWHLG